jgi:predicted lysophospholipase L1 biosynthesis ABC-type transport system permease subunit
VVRAQRHAGDPHARPADAQGLLESARRTVHRVAPGFAVQETTTMSRVLDTAVGPARQIMTLLSLLTGLALVLGAIGIYGVISHFAERRKRDWAIKVALGLPTRRVVTSIVGQGAGLVGAGIVSAWAARWCWRGCWPPSCSASARWTWWRSRRRARRC